MDLMQTVVITGANRGIGKEIAKGIAKSNYRIILACRNIDSANEAKEEIIRETGNTNVDVMRLDLADRASIDSFIEEISTRYFNLNILVNNAGISSSSNEKTIDGFEINIGTNFIGTYRLTMGLIPYFDATREKRIVNTTSNISAIGWFETKKINKYGWFIAYAVSKRMILLFTKWLSMEKQSDNYKINAVHPGIVDTSIMYTGKWFDVIIKAICGPFFISPKEGARPSIDLVLNNEIGNGKYYIKGKERDIKLSKRKNKEMKDLKEFCKRI